MGRSRRAAGASAAAAQQQQHGIAPSPSPSGSSASSGLALRLAMAAPTSPAAPPPQLLADLRRTSKRDPVTRLKALRALQEVTSGAPPPYNVVELERMLPLWADAFPRLSIDVDRRVREATLQLHGALLKQVGRAMAPHLRRLLPWWLAARFDPCSAAARAAITSFDDTFPAVKQVGAVLFARDELFAVVEAETRKPWTARRTWLA